MSGQKSTHVSDEKKNLVSELSELAKNKKTILIASIKNIPGSQFQEIVKKLRGNAIVKVPKKSLIIRALDGSGDEDIQKLKEQIKESTAILFSDMDSFELAGELLQSMSPAKAKAGQEAPEDIKVEAGPTDLVPGPAISELGAVGIPIQIEKGKIHIKESKVILKKGEMIKAKHADIMNKLDIKPFVVGFIPIASFDTQERKLYLELKIDREGTLKDLKYAFSRALPFAVEIGYVNDETIGFMIKKAGIYGKALEKFASIEEATPETANEETPKEDVKAEENQSKTPNESEVKEEQTQTPEQNSGEQGDK
jgi:large subunit ribosomal protein L10